MTLNILTLRNLGLGTQIGIKHRVVIHRLIATQLLQQTLALFCCHEARLAGLDRQQAQHRVVTGRQTQRLR